MTPDFKDLMTKAKAASLEERGWYAETDKGIVGQCGVRDAAFIAAASPTVIIALEEERERLREALKQIAKQKKTNELETACDVEYDHTWRRDMSELTEWLRAVAAGIQRNGSVVAESSTPYLDAADRLEALEQERERLKEALKQTAKQKKTNESARDHLIVSNGLSNKEILRLTKELAEAKARYYGANATGEISPPSHLAAGGKP